MATRPVLKVRKIKKIKPTRSEMYLVNLKYMGDEPLFTNDKVITGVDYLKANTWYTYMCSVKEARDYLDTYLKNSGRDLEAKIMKELSDNRLPLQACWIARMLSRGAKMTERSVSFMNDKIKEAILRKNKKDEEAEDDQIVVVAPIVKKMINIQDRVKDKVSDFIGWFEESIDAIGHSDELSMYDSLQKIELPPMLAMKVAEFYRPIAEEAKELLSSKCNAQLKEGFSRYSATDIKQRSIFYNKIITDCERYSSNTKKIRAPKAPKAVTVDKKIKFLNHSNESKEFKVVSIQPEKIIGAQELWLLNTKYKLLTVFYALDRGGLDLNRTSLIKYDETKSQTMRLGKNGHDHIATVLKNGKRNMTKMLTELKKIDNLQTRINENVIILKANQGA